MMNVNPLVILLVILQSLLNEVYERSGYDYFIDYQVDPPPPLSRRDLIWIDGVLREKNWCH